MVQKIPRCTLFYCLAHTKSLQLFLTPHPQPTSATPTHFFLMSSSFFLYFIRFLISHHSAPHLMLPTSSHPQQSLPSPVDPLCTVCLTICVSAVALPQHRHYDCCSPVLHLFSLPCCFPFSICLSVQAGLNGDDRIDQFLH